MTSPRNEIRDFAELMREEEEKAYAAHKAEQERTDREWWAKPQAERDRIIAEEEAQREAERARLIANGAIEPESDDDDKPRTCWECGAELDGSEDFEEICRDCDSLDEPEGDE